ncbi:peptidoglycan DD-metalloendopeptidase family protein [Thalassobaculum sp.]|uniref:M23 family metallopeptidase n=1 Tax=Thalassobaculum sp. TaxID=2022740 RepID=UPI003B5AEB0B
MTDESVGWADRAVQKVRRLLPERQIIIRTEGETSYLRLSTALQVSVIAIWVGVAGWVGFATVGFQNQKEMIAEKADAISRSRQAYRKLLDQVSDYQLSIVGITRDLKETEAHLRGLFSQNEELKQDLSSTEVALRSSEEERSRIASARKQMNDQLELFSSELRQTTGKNNALEAHIGTLRQHLAVVEAEKAEIAAERAALDDRLWALHNELEASSAKVALLESNVRALKTDLRTVILERSAVAVDNDTLRAQVADLESTLDSERDAHRRELMEISERTHGQIAKVEDVIRRTGLKLDKVVPLPREQATGKGGPFQELAPDMSLSDEDDALRVELERRLERWQQVVSFYTAMPLAKPLEEYYITSYFGRRKDPINGRYSMHSGVDLAGPYKQEVTATAPGVVSFAGRRTAYGRVIDIDHGHGLVTRYAHLAKIKVKVGQRVDLGTTIALLGSSGRSTGPHVHYEVRYNDKPINPSKFMKAGIHVQQQAKTGD